MANLRDRVFEAVKRINRYSEVIDRLEEKRDNHYDDLNRFLKPVIEALGLGNYRRVDKVSNRWCGWDVDLYNVYRGERTNSECFIPREVIDADSPIEAAKLYKAEQENKLAREKKLAAQDNARREIERLQKILAGE